MSTGEEFLAGWMRDAHLAGSGADPSGWVVRLEEAVAVTEQELATLWKALALARGRTEVTVELPPDLYEVVEGWQRRIHRRSTPQASFVVDTLRARYTIRPGG